MARGAQNGAARPAAQRLRQRVPADLTAALLVVRVYEGGGRSGAQTEGEGEEEEKEEDREEGEEGCGVEGEGDCWLLLGRRGG